MDKKSKMELTITAIGIIILAILILTTISKPKKKRHEPAVAEIPQAASSVALPVTSVDRYASMASWDKDPFYPEAPFINSGSGIAGVILNGIVWEGGENSYAIINNEIVKPGDKVNGMDVIEINEKNVVLDEKGNKHTMELTPL